MPPKRKNKKQNGFSMYMMDHKRSFEIELKRELTFSELVPLSNPGWAALSDEEKLVYNTRAKSFSQDRKYNDRVGGRMDCTGQLISERVDRMSLNESRRSMEQRQLIEKWPPGHGVCMEIFHFLAFETLMELPDSRGVLPCEIACVSYNLSSGIIDIYHKFIVPGRLPMGFRYQCQQKSDTTHKIPVENFELASDNYPLIWKELCDFLNPHQLKAFPPVFCQLQRRNEVEGCLRWLSDQAGVPNRLAKVFEAEVLLCELYVHGGERVPSHSSCTASLTTTTFDYSDNTRCKYHDDNEVAMDHCALGKAKKNCFCLSDCLASVYNIMLTSNHLPERHDTSTCLVIPPSANEFKYSNAKPRPMQPKIGVARGRSLDTNYRSRSPRGNHTAPISKVEDKSVEEEDEPLRRPMTASQLSLMATRQIQPMRDREMGTHMAMLQPNGDAPSKYALPAPAPPPSDLPLPASSWQGLPQRSSNRAQGQQSTAMPSKHEVPSQGLGRGFGVGLGRGLGRGYGRGACQ